MILGVVRNTVSILDCCRPVIFILDVVFECRSQFLFETKTLNQNISKRVNLSFGEYVM
jgi:hypothetical protein